MLLCIHKEFTKYDDIYLLKLINFKRRKGGILMEKILEWSIYIVFILLLCYKMINNWISERLEETANFIIYVLITVYLMIAEISANIAWVVIIGTVLFIPSIISRSYDQDEEDLGYAMEVLLCTINILIIIIKFGIMRIMLKM